MYVKVKMTTVPEEKNTNLWNYIPNFWDVWPARGLYDMYRTTLGLYTASGRNYIVTK
jgi:hypothetical protein